MKVGREAGSAFTFPFNLTGQPAASVPCGFTKAGLPIGLQIVGRRFADGTVLRAAACLERALRRRRAASRVMAAATPEEWLRAFEAVVRARDFTAGRAMFADDAVAFGTWARAVAGLENIVREQWQNVWPRIRDFRFEAGVHIRASGDSAWIAGGWLTEVTGPDGRPFSRPGRGTFVLERRGGTLARRAQPLLAAADPVRGGARAAPGRAASRELRSTCGPRAARRRRRLAEMANDLNDHVGVSGRPFTAARVRADGFGPRAAFTPLVAELDGAVVGYAFFTRATTRTSRAGPCGSTTSSWPPAARGRGAGAALMAAVAAETVRRGAVSLEWGVHASNAGALGFYRRLGAGGGEVRILGVDGDRLRALAAAARRRAISPGSRTRRRSAARRAAAGSGRRGRSA